MLVHAYIFKILRDQPKHIRRYAQKVYVHIVNNIPMKVVLEIQDNLKNDPERFKWPGPTIELECPPSIELKTGYDIRRQVIVHDHNTNETTVHEEFQGRPDYDVDYDYKSPSVLDFSVIRNESGADVAG